MVGMEEFSYILLAELYLHFKFLQNTHAFRMVVASHDSNDRALVHVIEYNYKRANIDMQ